MSEPITPTPQDTLSAFIAQQRAPLMAGLEWSVLQALDGLRAEFDGLLGGLDLAEKREYVRLQRAWIDAQHTMEQGIRQLTEAFELHALESLRSALITLTGQYIDPKVAKINTRYLKHSGRVRRELKGDEIKISSVTLWDAACMNYDGLTGWSYPGRTGLADASYLDRNINATAGEFIALVRRLDLGGQLRRRLDQALQANASLGSSIMRLANAEFEFALIEALRNTEASRVDRDKYQQVKRALAGEARWERVEEMLLFVPHGTDNISWLPQSIGLVGHYAGQPPGDSLSIPHIVFSVSGCKGAFSFIPNRPGGSLRHHASHRQACEVFHAEFHAAYRAGRVDWLYQIMWLRDCARLKQIGKTAQPRRDLEGLEKLVDWLARVIPSVNIVDKVGYVRNVVQKSPALSLNDFYRERSRANLQELAHQTPGFMPTMIELFQTLIGEILDVLLIPVPGALKG
ncbi:dermonecrotic toxin domain-containing protein, partial [Pseudomonas sp. MPBD4-3]